MQKQYIDKDALIELINEDFYLELPNDKDYLINILIPTLPTITIDAQKESLK